MTKGRKVSFATKDMVKVPKHVEMDFSLRQVQLDQIRARDTLLRLLERISGIDGELERRHFAVHFDYIGAIEDGSYGYKITRQEKQFVESTFRILQAVAHGELPSKQDLNGPVLDALN